MDFMGILEKTVSPDKAELEAVQNYLEQAPQNNLPEFPKSLSSVLSCATNRPVARMAAGLQLKNTLTSKDQDIRQEYQEKWLQFPAEVRSFGKQNGRSNLENNSCPKTDQQFGKVLQKTSTIKQKPLPLSTERLNACRYPLKNIAVVSILENGEVCVEWLKTKTEKQYVSCVVFISNNGKWIDTYKPRNCLVSSTPPPKPTDNKHINSFPYDDLPSNYWKTYRIAKALVDSVRAGTPKIAYYDEDGICVMMGNYPNSDFDMEFFDGGNIIQESNKISITDKWGQTISVAELDRSGKHFAVMWNKFCKSKEWCKTMEAHLDAKKSNGKIKTSPYPVMFRNLPLEKTCNSTKENFKENIDLPSSEVPATSKYTHNSYERTINSSNKYTFNSPSTYSSSSPNNIDAILMKLKGSPQLIKGEVYIEYKVGYSVRCSKDRELVQIYDSRKKCVYHSQYNDNTDSLIDMILQDLPFFSSLSCYEANCYLKYAFDVFTLKSL